MFWNVCIMEKVTYGERNRRSVAGGHDETLLENQRSESRLFRTLPVPGSVWLVCDVGAGRRRGADHRLACDSVSSWLARLANIENGEDICGRINRTSRITHLPLRLMFCSSGSGAFFSV